MGFVNDIISCVVYACVAVLYNQSIHFITEIFESYIVRPSEPKILHVHHLQEEGGLNSVLQGSYKESNYIRKKNHSL